MDIQLAEKAFNCSGKILFNNKQISTGLSFFHENEKGRSLLDCLKINIEPYLILNIGTSGGFFSKTLLIRLRFFFN